MQAEPSSFASELMTEFSAQLVPLTHSASDWINAWGIFTFFPDYRGIKYRLYLYFLYKHGGERGGTGGRCALLIRACHPHTLPKIIDGGTSQVESSPFAFELMTTFSAWLVPLTHLL